MSVLLEKGNRIAIIDGVRSVMGKAGGSLSTLEAEEIASQVLRSLRYRMLSENITDIPQEVILGNVAQPAHAANISRVALLYSGIEQSVHASTVHRNCASGMEAITVASHKILSSPSEGSQAIYYAGGVESMSNIPMLLSKKTQSAIESSYRARGFLQKIKAFKDIRLKELMPRIGIILGLTDPTSGLIMGQTAEGIAQDFSISRADQDQYSCRSHQLAEHATAEGLLQGEIVPICANWKTGEMPTTDEGFRNNQSIESLAKLKPYFEKPYGTVTVGNSSQLTDGGCVISVTHESTARKMGINPIAYIKGFGYSGCNPLRMGLGPVFSTTQLLAKAKMNIGDIDLFEINEAFAVQVLGCLHAFQSEVFYRDNLREFSPLGGIPLEKVNANGGAIALGHPVGMTGARIILHAAKELKRRNLSTAISTLCVGGGQGGTVLLERE